MERSELWQNFMVVAVPFLAYFLGVVIRKIALPGPNSPALSHQLLLAIPFSLVLVPPLLKVLESSIRELSVYLVTVGIIIEHGMVLHETASRQLKQLAEGGLPRPPA